MRDALLLGLDKLHLPLPIGRARSEALKRHTRAYRPLCVCVSGRVERERLVRIFSHGVCARTQCVCVRASACVVVVVRASACVRVSGRGREGGRACVRACVLVCVCA